MDTITLYMPAGKAIKWENPKNILWVGKINTLNLLGGVINISYFVD